MADVTAPAADGQGLAQLEKSGNDLSKLHEFDFELRFATQKAAERSTLMLEGLAFATRVQRGKTDAEWLVHAVKRLYPVESDLIGLREKLEDIARQHRGVYLGWRAKIAEYPKR
jgi:Regulator of ribonuclease activity B